MIKFVKCKITFKSACFEDIYCVSYYIIMVGYKLKEIIECESKEKLR